MSRQQTISKEPLPEPDRQQKRRLKAHFGFARTPFSKYMWASRMFDSGSQRELLAGLHMWTEVRGLALVSGATGVGKSITLRRFLRELSDDRFRVFDFSYLPSTRYGFLRSLARKLGVPMRQHATDLFDAVRDHLSSWEGEHGAHPIVLVDDAEGLSVPVLDTIRRLTAVELDAEDRFSILLAGTEELVDSLRHPTLLPLRSRFCFAHTLKPFGFEDTRNYVAHHLHHADVDRKTFTDDAVRGIFQHAVGTPRAINQLALQGLIRAAALGQDEIDGGFMQRVVADHPLYAATRRG